MIDVDLAILYGVENRVLRQAVRRNIDSFPDDFLLRLSLDESNSLIHNGVSQLVIPSGYNTGGAGIFAFTEQGVAMLATVLKSKNAKEVSIAIMRAFVAMRRFLASNAQVFQRLDSIEYRLLESDRKFEDLYSKLEEKSLAPKQGIFYDGQIYDSYTFATDLIQSAKQRIILIDNYVDNSVLTMLDKRAENVTAEIYTLSVSHKFRLDIEKHDQQYSPIPVKVFTKAHDRFLIIDEKVYHFGASLKDLGKKWFAFSLMEETSAAEILSRL